MFQIRKLHIKTKPADCPCGKNGYIYSEKRHILSSKDDQGKRTKVTRLNRERFSMNLFSGTNWNVGFESCKSDDAAEIDPRKRTYVNRNQYSKKGTKYVFTKSENKRTT